MLLTDSNISLKPDAKGRITLGKLAEGISSFKVFVDKDSRIILEPYAEIPARELWLWKNKKAMASFNQGIEDIKNGKTKPLGDLSKYLDE